MPWNDVDLRKILMATGEPMTIEHLDARLSVAEETLGEFKKFFAEHIKHEETAIKSVNDSIHTLTRELGQTNSLIREQALNYRNDLLASKVELKAEIHKELQQEFNTFEATHTELVKELIDKFESRQSDTGKRVGALETMVIALNSSNELLKKVQIIVATAVVAAILKSIGLV
jgi:hypothetical protein